MDLDEFLTDDVPSDLDDELCRAGWTIEGDQRANAALRRLAREEAEVRRIEAAAQAELDKILEWKHRAQSIVANRIQFLTDNLTDYYRQLERDNPKIAQTYKLPNGSLRRAKLPDKVVVTDEEAFIKWAQEFRPEALTIKPKVSEVKGRGFMRETTPDVPIAPVVDASSGEFVPGVQCERGEVRYTVKVNDTEYDEPEYGF